MWHQCKGTMPHTVLLLFVLLCTAALVMRPANPPSATAPTPNGTGGLHSPVPPLRPTTRPKLPTDMTQWVYGPGPAFANLSSTRLWDRAFLQQASTVAMYEQMRGFLSKLHAGLPVTAVALGDSNTQHFGGCFGRSDDAQFAERGVQTIQRPDDTYPCVKGSMNYVWFLGSPPLGWLSGFMHLINATFPHSEHLLRNLGLSGNSFRESTVGECIESYLPKQVDLLVLEHMPFLETPDARAITDIERLLNRIRLYLDPPLPAVIFVNLLDIQGYFQQECDLDAAKCAGLCPATGDGFHAGFPRSDAAVAAAAEAHTDQVAAHHGLASLSHVTAVRTLLRGANDSAARVTAPGSGGGAGNGGSNGLHRRMLEQGSGTGGGLAAAEGQQPSSSQGCELLATLYLGRVHPNTTGRLLLADLLTNYLVEAEQHLLAAPAPTAAAVPATLRQRPRVPLHPESDLVYRLRCYYSAEPDGAAGGEQAQQAAGPPGDGGQQQGGAAGLAAAQGRTASSAARTVAPLKVLKAQGWEHVWIEGDNGKKRPGWVAKTPGAVLWLELDAAPLLQGSVGGLGFGTDVGAAAAVGPEDSAAGADASRTGDVAGERYNATIFVSLTHLQSYQRMGRANVTCVSGCTCAVDNQLDGHAPHMLASVPVPFVFEANVTEGGSGRCVVAVEVAADEEHRRHKVKVIQVAVGALRNMKQALDALLTR